MAIDLVCGMEVDEKTAVHKSEYEGKVYYFCSPGCKRELDREPQKYIGRHEPPQMHPHHG